MKLNCNFLGGRGRGLQNKKPSMRGGGGGGGELYGYFPELYIPNLTKSFLPFPFVPNDRRVGERRGELS